MSRNQKLHLAVGFWSLLAGVSFYILTRGYLISPGIIVLTKPILTASELPLFILDSFPSLIHTFAFMCLSVAAGAHPFSAMLLWTTLGTSWEVIQGTFPIFGTADPKDVFACIVGALLGFIYSVRTLVTTNAFKKATLRAFQFSIYGLGLLTCLATSHDSKIQEGRRDTREREWDIPVANDDYNDDFNRYEPVYMPYEDLRKAFAVESPRALVKAGKMLVLGSTLFVSEPNIGIHVFDNSDPTSPKALHFINLPGNVDLAAKGSTLYADSFVDLVAIQLDGDKPQVIKRVEDTFAWNPYQAINDKTVRFEGALLDPKRGVIVGARKKDVQKNALGLRQKEQQVDK